ncbi:hypothetical protein JVU11DRAFT_10375 [Chiua virens]|nr:hypothetical protein JVU11DRAFT_10375 [Chiua virens]
MPPARLPSAKDAKLEHDPSALSAYDVCLALEDKSSTEENRMHARILGYLILHAASGSTTALAEIVRAIHSCSQDDQNLLNLGKCFRLWFILPFKKAKGRTPAPSDHPSRLSFDRLKEDLKATITEAPKDIDHRQAKAQALIRDRYQCVATGRYDLIAHKESIVDVETIAAAGTPVHTELAHILPESTYFGISNTRGSSLEMKDYSASVLAVMQRFGYDVEKVNGAKVHSLYNVMTMQKDVHDWFDRLEMWFESTEVVNRYRIRTLWPEFKTPRAEVMFTSPNSVIYPVPSPQLLALHAACAKVAHLSGAGEYIDKFDCDTDNLSVLATDGSSWAILTHALWKSTTSPVGIEA